MGIVNWCDRGLVINHCIRVSNVNVAACWIACHICSSLSVASWLPSHLLASPAWGIMWRSTCYPLISLTVTLFTDIIVHVGCRWQEKKGEKTKCARRVDPRAAVFALQSRLWPDEHMANILSHVIEGKTNIVQCKGVSGSRASWPAMQTLSDNTRRGALAFRVYKPHKAYLCTHSSLSFGDISWTPHELS